MIYRATISPCGVPILWALVVSVAPENEILPLSRLLSWDTVYTWYVTSGELFDLLAIAPDDRLDCERLLEGAVDQTAVAEAKALLLAGLGRFGETPFETRIADPMVWLTAFLGLTPTVVEWHRLSGVPTDVTRASFADVGRNVAKNRQVHSEFGLETWQWLTPLYTGMMFTLGRLNFKLQTTDEKLVGVLAPGDWILGIHIPESGPLTSEMVDASLVQAKTFFARCFPDQPVAIATCVSWMLDPYLREHMSVETNIGSFARRFTAMGCPQSDPTSALFFVFRTRDLGQVPTLPRNTTLQRLVLDRAVAGDPWQIGAGYLRL